MCGPKLTCFILLISVWGVCFLTVVGGLFYNQSVGLLEDLPEEENHVAKTYGNEQLWPKRRDAINDLYRQNAYNSWIAAAGHLAIGVLCVFRLCCLRPR